MDRLNTWNKHSVTAPQSILIEADTNHTIMVVDDEMIIRTLTGKILMNAGFQVILAEDGEAAIKTYQQRHKDISLILMDLTMPKLDGMEALHELVKINSSIKVLFHSGHSDQDICTELENNKSLGFIQKPYKQEELTEKIKQMLSKQTSQI